MPAQDITKTSIIKVNNLSKAFRVGELDVQILKGLNAEIFMGDFVVIFGPSGCGKSTFLHILLGLEPPSEGEILFLDQNLYAGKTEDDRADFRKKHIGMVYQQSNWIKSLTVRENIAFPLMLLGMSKPMAMSKSYEMLLQVNMQDWADYIPTELSGGQQQRVSLARALINNPEIIIADEPTGNLDLEAGKAIMQLFLKLNREIGKTVIMVTHDLEFLQYAKTAIRMLDGKIIGIYDEEQKTALYDELKSTTLRKMTEAPEENPQNPSEKTDENKENVLENKDEAQAVKVEETSEQN